jgi:electron transport complex protein RnfB
MSEPEKTLTRRDLLRQGACGACVVGLGGVIGVLADRSDGEQMVWQIDPLKCNQCGKCATNCVLEISAVRCVHQYAMCGYCDLCTGYFTAEPSGLNTAAENMLCPTGAIKRTLVEDPYYQYTIEEELCIGCGLCAKGCNAFGNGSLFLQVRHDRCLNCNECSIAAACPTQAYRRVPASKPYIMKLLKGAE